MSGQSTLFGLSAPPRVLCRVEDIPGGGARGYPGPPGSFTGLFAVRRGERVFVYLNRCPHIGTSLNLLPDRFLSADASRIICVTHGAEFRIEDGLCLDGPCLGERLEAIPAAIRDGHVLVPSDAGA